MTYPYLCRYVTVFRFNFSTVASNGSQGYWSATVCLGRKPCSLWNVCEELYFSLNKMDALPLVGP